MITRACISINNMCNLACRYCHFHEKQEQIHEQEMDIARILSLIIRHIEKHNLPLFKLGFVGNGEPLLEYTSLKDYILQIDAYLQTGRIAAYTITNGLLLDYDKLLLFKQHKINVGFSIDGIQPIHDLNRCNTHAKVMEKLELYHEVFGKYPSMNCTVGHETLQHKEETIDFFSRFGSRITFSRMIGRYGITLQEFRAFLDEAKAVLNVRTGGYDCTMYGGLCGAGIDNIFYANGQIFICGNCIDLPYRQDAYTELDEIRFNVPEFDRQNCFKEVLMS